MSLLLLLLVSSASAHPGGHAIEAQSQHHLTDDPCALEPRLQRATAWRSDGAFEHAASELEQAAVCHPDEPRLDLEWGLLLLARGDDVHARSRLSAFLAAEGPHAGALLARSRARHRTADLEGAMSDLAAALERMEQPRPEHYLRLARGLAALQRRDEALAVARAGVEDVGQVRSLLRTVDVLEAR